MVRIPPGLYVQEIHAHRNAVVRVPTDVPAFIGYTEAAEHAGESLHNTPWRIGSMDEFHQTFGGAPTPGQVRFSLDALAPDAPDAAEAADAALAEQPLGRRDAAPFSVGNRPYRLVQTHGLYLLYRAVAHYFLNGGGPCWVVSVGTYQTTEVDGVAQPAAGVQIEAAALAGALAVLQTQPEPAIVVVPECVLLSPPDCASVQQQLLTHCGEGTPSRFAILDVREGYLGRRDGSGDVVQALREGIGTSHLSYGAAYYPWLATTLLQGADLGVVNIHPDSHPTLMACLSQELLDLGLAEPEHSEQQAELDSIASLLPETSAALGARLASISPAYRALMTELARRLNLLPPSGAVAAVYATTDRQRGVWKAPANVALLDVIGPSVAIAPAEQDDLTVSVDGKSVNALRAFTGKGTLVWGGRTLDGNSHEWRYVSVRRTLIMVETSIQRALQAMVLEPNEARTWATLRAMVADFLTELWREGGLVGATPKQAFDVRVGLGQTMTEQDVLDGTLHLQVLLAVSRPAEFLVISFQQRLQAP